MPTYVYECQKCHYQFEEFQSMTDAPIQRCPKCRCKVKRLIMPGGGLVFKGSGFYETDYKRKESGSSISDQMADSKSEPSSGSKKDK